MGLPISAIEKVWAELDLIQGNNTAKGSVDIALHDALAKHLGLPLYQMLGGWVDRIGLTWIVGLASIEQMLEDAMTASAKGFKSFKIKIGDSTEKDVEVIRLIREALGNDVLLYVDANQAYTPTEAMRALPRMMEYGVEIVEDPIPHWHTESRLKLARMLPVPLLGDESVVSPMDIKREIDTGALGMINIKTARSGFYQSRKIIHLAEQAGYRCLIGTLLETDIGALASAHFGAAFRAFTYPAELTYHLKMQDHLLDSPLNIQDGSLILPTAPGLGIELDEEKLERYRVKSFGSH
jgi:L-alanine-DL-glutamate epimerase-like enolase superfamily enzyme